MRTDTKYTSGVLSGYSPLGGQASKEAADIIMFIMYIRNIKSRTVMRMGTQLRLAVTREELNRRWSIKSKPEENPPPVPGMDSSASSGDIPKSSSKSYPS